MIGQIEILKQMLERDSIRYIVVKTKYTSHHIEKLLASCKDRGALKWIAETDYTAYEKVEKDDESKRSYIDGHDLFPRVFFFVDSLCNELCAWLRVRNLEITDIRAPRI